MNLLEAIKNRLQSLEIEIDECQDPEARDLLYELLDICQVEYQMEFAYIQKTEPLSVCD